MEPPFGFIRLSEAVYAVGYRVYGPDWRPANDWPPPNTWRRKGSDSEIRWSYPFNRECKDIIKRVAEWCASGEIAAVYRNAITGDVENLDRDRWQRPQWRNYFFDGTIDLDLPLVHDLRPNAEGYTARCPREIFVREQDINQLVKALPTPQKSAAGAKPQWDWTDIELKFVELATERGDWRREENQLPGWEKQIDVAEALFGYVRKHYSSLPDAKTMDSYIRKWRAGHPELFPRN
jgi:hypothetical protein